MLVLRIMSALFMPFCAGFAFVMSLNVSPASTPPVGMLWEPIAVVFGASLGYAIVLPRRPRRLRGSRYFLLAGACMLGFALWPQATGASFGARVVLFVAAGANLAAAVLADDGPGGSIPRAALWFYAHPWLGGFIVGGAIGLFVASMDLAFRGDLPGAGVRGLALGALGALLQRFTMAAAAMAAQASARHHLGATHQEMRR